MRMGLRPRLVATSLSSSQLITNSGAISSALRSICDGWLGVDFLTNRNGQLPLHYIKRRETWLIGEAVVHVMSLPRLDVRLRAVPFFFLESFYRPLAAAPTPLLVAYLGPGLAHKRLGMVR